MAFTLLRNLMLIGIKNTLVGVKITLLKGQILLGARNTLFRGLKNFIKGFNFKRG